MGLISNWYEGKMTIKCNTYIIYMTLSFVSTKALKSFISLNYAILKKLSGCHC